MKDYTKPWDNDLIVSEMQFSDTEGGRWVTINGAHIFIKDGEDPQDAIGRLRQMENLGVLKSNRKHGHEWLNPDRVPNDLSFKAGTEGKQETVPIGGLIFTQAGVNDKKVKSMAADPTRLDSTEVSGLKTSDNKYILLDGHHRVAAMESVGKKSVRMKVLSVSKRSNEFGIIGK